MKIPLYRQALSKSWKLAWGHVWLWPLGLFAALLGQMGILEILSRMSVTFGNYSFISKFSSIPWSTAHTAGAYTLSGGAWISVVWLGLLLLALVIGLALVAVISQGALVDVAAKSVSRKKFPDVGVSWHVGGKHVWRVFLVNFLKKGFIIMAAFFVGWATTNQAMYASGGSFLLYLFVIVVSVFVGLLVSFLAVYAVGYIVVEKYRVTDAIVASWRLFTAHWLVSLEVAFLLLGANIVIAAVAFFGVFLFFIPSFVLWFIALAISSPALVSLGIIVGFILSSIFLMFLGAVFSVFTTSVWTYLFVKMHKHGIKSRILHWVK